MRGITLNKSVDLKSEKTRMTSLSQRPTACASRQKSTFFYGSEQKTAAANLERLLGSPRWRRAPTRYRWLDNRCDIKNKIIASTAYSNLYMLV